MPDTAGESLRSARPGLPEQRNDQRRRLILAACLIATFMAAVESTIVATIIPTIVSDLGGFDLFSWVFTAYLLTQAVTIPVYGRLADLFGRKPVFFFGTAVFLIGTLLCGLAWNMQWLVCFRALQGCGAGAIQPIAATILGDIYTPAERGRIQGLVASVFGVSAVIGPSLGAFLVQHIGWRAVFWVNLPVGLAAIIMIGVFLREEVHRRSRRIDWAGALLLLLAFGCLMLAMVQSGTLGGATLAVLITIGVIALIALYLQERTTPEPMLPLELWRNRVIVVGSVGSFTAGAMMMGVAAFLPTYIQGAMGRPAVEGGLVLGAMSVTWALASILAGRIMTRTSYRLIAMLGGVALVARLRDAGGPEACRWANLGHGGFAGHRHRNGVLQHRLHRLDPGVRPLAPARRGDVVMHVHALRRPIDRRRDVWRGTERHDIASRSRRHPCGGAVAGSGHSSGTATVGAGSPDPDDGRRAAECLSAGAWVCGTDAADRLRDAGASGPDAPLIVTVWQA